MNRLLLSAAALCGTAASLLALPVPQTSVRGALQTGDAIAVNANRVIDGARGGVTIERALALHANDGREVVAHSMAANALFRTHAGEGVGARFAVGARASAGNVAGTLAGSPWAAGPQTYELTLTARQAVQGDLFVLFGGMATDARAAASVRVGRVVKTFTPDGTPQRDVFEDLTVDANGVTVAIALGGQANPPATSRGAAFHLDLQVFFVADAGGGGGGCTVTPGQRSCPEGGRLTGTIVRDPRGHGPALGLGLAGALPDAIGLTLISPTGRTFPIGMTNCVFFQTAILHGTFQTDGMGNARTLVPFPMRAGGSFSAQQATVIVSPRGLRFATSNTVDVSCN